MDRTTGPHVEHRDHSHRSPPLLFVHEFISGGGFAGTPLPPGLLREGSAMAAALLADLAALGRRRIVTTRDVRAPLELPPGVEAIAVEPGRHADVFRELARAADEVWIIAPEADDRLAALTETAERLGTRVIGSSARAIRAASDKLGLARSLARWGLRGPRTWSTADAARLAGDAARVVKPRRGAGCEGVRLARTATELSDALAEAAAVGPEVIVQEYVGGCAASVSLICADGRARPLSLNGQRIEPGDPFEYRGGHLPLDHPAAAQALEATRRVCERLPGLAGYVGVDLVLAGTGGRASRRDAAGGDAAGGREGAFVIEVNPRLTTSYLGLRAATDANVAGRILDAVTTDRLPDPLPPLRPVRFSTDRGVPVR